MKKAVYKVAPSKQTAFSRRNPRGNEMEAAKLGEVDARLNREDRHCTKHDSQFSEWKVLIGPNDWEDYSPGKGVTRYRTENLPICSSSGLYELAVYRRSSSSRENSGNIDPLKVVMVYLGEADNVRTRLQQYGRAGAHLCTSRTATASEEKTCGRFKDIFTRGYSIVYRWAPMKNKAEAQKTEAQLLDTFDYAWNKGSNGTRRHDDILEKLDKCASNFTDDDDDEEGDDDEDDEDDDDEDDYDDDDDDDEEDDDDDDDDEDNDDDDEDDVVVYEEYDDDDDDDEYYYDDDYEDGDWSW